MGDEIIVHDAEIWTPAVLALHHFRQMLPQLHGKVLAAGIQNRICGLAGAGAQLQHRFPRPQGGVLDELGKKLRSVSGAISVKQFGDRVKNPSRFHGSVLLSGSWQPPPRPVQNRVSTLKRQKESDPGLSCLRVCRSVPDDVVSREPGSVKPARLSLCARFPGDPTADRLS